MAGLKEGQRLRLVGEEDPHPKFGPQIKVETFEAIAPSSAAGIEAYLASGLVKGIGPATATKIVDEFGDDTLRVIEEEPDKLKKVRGLGAKVRVGWRLETPRALTARASDSMGPRGTPHRWSRPRVTTSIATTL